MKVLFTGATGVIGRAAVPRLVQAGHDVTGVSQTAEGSEWLRRSGARAVQIDLLDEDMVSAAMEGIDWSDYGLPPASNLRVGLHAGPVYSDHDPVMDRDNYYGANVTRAARVEPITPPGMVYATETFAALLAVEGGPAHDLEYVGRVELAKGYGRSRVYRLARAW